MEANLTTKLHYQKHLRCGGARFKPYLPEIDTEYYQNQPQIDEKECGHTVIPGCGTHH